MKFEGFYGNARIKEYLSNAVSRGEISHAFMLSGPEGIGKTTLGGILARALVCQSDGEKPCGTCAACIKSAKDAHPDILHIRRSEASIKVKEIRALKQDAYLRPNDGARKVYLIHEADTMTPEAQDALLKILEEPPAFTVFLLLCYNEKMMLETVRSRCVRLTLAPLDNEEMTALLKERFPRYGQDELAKIVSQARGIAGRALIPHEDGPAEECSMRILSAAAAGDELGIAEGMIAIEKSKREELVEIIDCTVAHLRDALITPYGGESFYADDVSAKLYARAGNRGILNIIDALSRAKAYCRQNVGVAHITGFLTCEIARAVRK